jgi:NAD(P)-dependent dehydrogenase (short-subunit alcohol dehydrogenase family)
MKKAKFVNKVSIVTGGASGIGRSLCMALAKMDAAMVIVADINGDQARETAVSIRDAGGQAQAADLDVSDADAFQQLIDQTVATHGRIDLIFNNAGISMSGEASDITLAHWHNLMDVSLWGVIHGTSMAYKIMRQQGFGHIVNVSSAGGLMPIPLGLPYATAKTAVVGLSTALCAEAAAFGINVTVACPGTTRTAIFDMPNIVTPMDTEKLMGNAMYSKMMSADECARIILKGVGRNKAIVPITAATKIMWWLNRLSPKLAIAMGKMIAKQIRLYQI